MKRELIEHFENIQIADKQYCIPTGSQVKITNKINDGKKTRTQAFTGIVISSNGDRLNKSILVRAHTSGEWLERRFFLNSKLIESIHIQKRYKVRKSKIYFIRANKNKKTKLRQMT